MKLLLAFFGPLGVFELIILLAVCAAILGGTYVVSRILKNTSETAKNTRDRGDDG